MEVVEVAAGLARCGFWHGKRVLVTGHTGFKGAWLTAYLSRLEARVTGVSLAPNTSPSLFEAAAIVRLVSDSHFVDIRDAAALGSVVESARPEVVFHLAAQSLVRSGYGNPLGTFETNVMGTVNLLEALRKSGSAQVAVMVTTDKVYENRERAQPYVESDPLGGHDPYSASKAASELVIQSYRRSYLSRQGMRVASARAGNVVGGGDWAPDRLVPDMVRAWRQGVAVQVRNPEAIRPWQHVIEPVAAYLVLAQRLWDDPSTTGAYNFGPRLEDAASVRQVVEIARACWGAGAEEAFGVLPAGPHEARLLSLDSSRARRVLGVSPKWNLGLALGRTINWYRRFIEGSDALQLIHEDIDAWEAGV